MLAVTVVAAPPAFYDVRSWGNEAMDFQQEVTVLTDPAAAREAFRELVTTIDACPTYREVDTGVEGTSWTAQPAIEGQGVYPSIVLEVDRTTGGTTIPAYEGQMLVGNTIVSWTAQALSGGTSETALATLAELRVYQGRTEEAERLLDRIETHPAARAAVDAKVSEWTGETVDDAGVQDIIAADTRFD